MPQSWEAFLYEARYLTLWQVRIRCCWQKALASDRPVLEFALAAHLN